MNKKDIVIAGISLLAGYYIGFYEMKYKALKALWQVEIEKNNEPNSNKKEGAPE